MGSQSASSEVGSLQTPFLASLLRKKQQPRSPSASSKDTSLGLTGKASPPHAAARQQQQPQRSVSSVLEVLTPSQHSMSAASLAEQLSLRSSRDGSFFSRSSSTTAAGGGGSGGGVDSAAGRDNGGTQRHCLLSRLLKARPSLAASPSATAGALAEQLQPSDAGGCYGGADGDAALSSSSSSPFAASDGVSSPPSKRSMGADDASLASAAEGALQMQGSGGAARLSRFAHLGGKPLSWSVDASTLSGGAAAEPNDYAKASCDDGAGQEGAAECYVVATPTTRGEPASGKPVVLTMAGKPAVSPAPPAGGEDAQQQHMGRQRPSIMPPNGVHVHELAAAFERRCAASAAAAAASPPKSRQSPGPVSPSMNLPAVQASPPQQQPLLPGSTCSPQASKPPAASSPFCTMDGQKTAQAAWHQWASAAEQQQQLQQQASVPAGDGLRVSASMQSYLQQQLQLQQQHSAPSTAAGATSSSSLPPLAPAASLAADGGNSSSLVSQGSGGSGAGSPFKPRPPASGASPQRSRPGMALRQSGSAPLLVPAPVAVQLLPPGAAAHANTTASASAAAGPGQAVDPGAAGTDGRATPEASAAVHSPARSGSMPVVPGPLTLHRPGAGGASGGPLSPSKGVTAAATAAADAAVAAAASRQLAAINTSAGSSSPVQHRTAAAAAAPSPHAASAAAFSPAAAPKPPAAAPAASPEAQMQQQQAHAPAPRMSPQQLCAPIAIARHCPRDLQGANWQPRDFVQTKKLYEGKIAAVVQGYHAASGRPLALKVYNRARLDTMERFQLAREVCLHMRSCHPAITTLYAAYKDSRYIYLLMELAPSGNLYQMLMAMAIAPGRPRCLSERDAVVRVIRPLLSALGYLHDQGIIHRDIKLENVLLTAEGSIKLADFGLSIDTRHEPANTRLGTQGYFAPEVLALPLKSSPFEGKSPEEAAARPSYDCKVDVWSAGVVCFEVLTGRAPFAAENVAQVLHAILHRQLSYPSHLSPAAVSFLSTALTRDPNARPGVRALLQHPFITSHVAAAAASGAPAATAAAGGSGSS